MNKLIVTLMMTLGTTLSVFSNPCSDIPQKPCVFGYQIKVFVKTTQGEVITNCGPCKLTACIRTPAIKRLAGFIYGVSDDCGCNAWDKAELLIWDYDTKTEAMPKVAKIDVLDRILSNGEATTTELAFTFDHMKYAGFGRSFKRDGKPTLKYATGFCAGTMPKPNCVNCYSCGDIVPSCAWTICGDSSNAPDCNPKETAAYGKWTIDWSSTVYNRVMNGQTLIPGASWETITPKCLKNKTTM